MGATATRPARAGLVGFFERHAWKVLLAVAAIIVLFGLGDLFGGAAALEAGETVFIHAVTGQSWAELRAASPAAADLIDHIFRSNGVSLLMLGLLSAAICLTAYRRHERWAWLTLWAQPAWLALTALTVRSGIRYPQFGTPAPVISGSLLAVICALSLLASARPFFRGAAGAPRL